MNEFIPLLAPKALSEFSPSGFKLYITGLYFKREPKKAAPKKKKLRELKVTARILKSGLVSLTTRREPKYVTAEEIAEVCKKTERQENEIFISLTGQGFIVTTHEDAQRIRGDVDAIPF